MKKTLTIVTLLFCGVSNATDCVILLHGLARTSNSMEDMAEALAESGYRVANVSYPSREHPIEKLAPMAVNDGLPQYSRDSIGLSLSYEYNLTQNETMLSLDVTYGLSF